MNSTPLLSLSLLETLSGAAQSLFDLAPAVEESESTIANLELGFRLNSQTELILALNPVLFHSGGETHFGTVVFSNETSYDTHSARAGLRHTLPESGDLRIAAF